VALSEQRPELFGVPVHITSFLPKGTALFVHNGEIVGKIMRLTTATEDERITAAVSAERARVVREVVNRLRHKARSQGNTVAQSALMDAAADIQFRMLETAAPRGTTTEA
jgi:hypothetical protein